MSEKRIPASDDSTPLSEGLTADVIEEFAVANRHLQRAELLLYRYRGGLLYPAEVEAAYQLRECAESVQYAFEYQHQTNQSMFADQITGLPDERFEELIAVTRTCRNEEHNRESR